METKTKYQKGTLTKGEKNLWEAVKNLPKSDGVDKLDVEWKTHGLFGKKGNTTSASKRSH